MDLDARYYTKTDEPDTQRFEVKGKNAETLSSEKSKLNIEKETESETGGGGCGIKMVKPLGR